MPGCFGVFWQNLFAPKVWPELLRKVCNRFRSKQASTEYLQTLAKQARPYDEIILTLFDISSVSSISHQFEDIKTLTIELQDSVSRCPVKLGGGAHLELLLALTRLSKPEVVVETGVAYGWSSAVILLGLDQNQSGRLFSSDLPYPRILNAREYVGWIVPERLRQRWTLLLGPDRLNLPKLLDSVEKIDMFHYDSDKSYRGRLWALHQVWPKMSEGGLLISDDIQDNEAFHDFCREQGQHIYITEYQGKYIGLCRKQII